MLPGFQASRLPGFQASWLLIALLTGATVAQADISATASPSRTDTPTDTAPGAALLAEDGDGCATDADLGRIRIDPETGKPQICRP